MFTKSINVKHQIEKKTLIIYIYIYIECIFSHEPHIAAEPLPWTNALPARFKKDNGYDILEVLPLLVLRGGDETSKVRCDFYETVSDLYEEAWELPQDELC